MRNLKILLLDNYDSFTYNLAHYIEDITGKLPEVYRNDKISISSIEKYDAIILSPGPGLPNEAGILKKVITTYAGKIPIFGVCLGLQAITEAFGGCLENLNNVFHGVATKMIQTKSDVIIFKNIPKKFKAARYHSWIASKKKFPNDLEVTCEDKEGKIMALRHKKYLIEAVQFHPESILTPDGKKIIKNFIDAVNNQKLNC